MTRDDLQNLSLMRLSDAKALLAGGTNAGGAYYLAGYAVECALKARIARKRQLYEFPDKALAISAYEHIPDKLIKVAELTNELQAELKNNEVFKQNWSVVQSWSAESRYQTATIQTQAEKLIDAIEDPTNGVLQWLKNYW